ncbi:MAG: hypothetical protein WC635_14960 [Bacteriovorax sp.]
MNTKLTALMVSIILSLSTNAFAQIKEYQSTDNTGLNKQERIETVEGYLTNLAKTLQTMEAKLNENSSKLGDLDKLVKKMVADKEATDKILKEKSAEKKPKDGKQTVGEQTELEKLKADILVLKNEDIEKLKLDFREMIDTIRALQATMRIQLEMSENEKVKKGSSSK